MGLPLDRFLSFYYAHPGFHINNLFIILSVQLFMFDIINLGALKHETISCRYNRNVPVTDPLFPTGCANLAPIQDWVMRCVLSIFIVFSSSSPFFEVFVCQIYANSLHADLSYGGARYIG